MVTVVSSTGEVHAPVCKYVLRQRAQRLFAITGLVVAVSTVALTRSIMPFELALAAASWAVTVLPVFLLRRYNLQLRRTTEPTQRAFVRALAGRAKTWEHLGLMAASGAAEGVIYVMAVYSNAYDDPKLTPFAPSKRHAQHLNERFVFLLLCLSSAGALYAARDQLRQRFVVRWAPKSHKTVGIAIRSRIAGTLLRVFAVSVLFPAFFHILYLTFRIPTIRILLRVFPFLRPTISLFLRRPGDVWSLHLYQLAVSALFKLSLAWSTTHVLFDAYTSHPPHIAPHIAPATIPGALVKGVENTEMHGYFAHLAWLDVARMRAPERRALFADPPLWAALVRSALLKLGRDYQLLLRRGAPAPAPAPPPKAPAVPPATPSKPAALAPASAAYKPASSPLRALADDGAVTRALTAVPDVFLDSPHVQKAVGKIKEHLPDTSAYAKAIVAAPQRRVEPFVALPPRALALWGAPFPDADGDKWAPDARTDAAIVDALTRLVAASLEEDALGTVQRDVPRVLEALCALLDAAEDAQAAGGRPVAVLADALRSGIQLVCATFGDRMRAFRVPVRTASKLQGFVDYL
ncbi:hypothetical protein AURDEDRAFT_186764 [Auricularia subglabra TFB-10046 SS5]|uniref:Nucleoporin protein Ndc1-Nup n=1 Tax=Auricularia subglabra (strain TFB-10046 / SS5) TaxID=717982 RepID=J0DD16_AURST|nr:hypothetical protein AURDEDRAFT_186764 [Auricularia subglabra TFB-10046 SS5]